MNCTTCDTLLGEYRFWVSRLKDAVLNIPGALGDDPSVFAEQAERCRLKCNDAGCALMAHWRHQHRNRFNGALASSASA
jgi:hypothetical protein